MINESGVTIIAINKHVVVVYHVTIAAIETMQTRYQLENKCQMKNVKSNSKNELCTCKWQVW